ncbi:hypothetical protein SD51_08095 [Alicyclobacillus tengchongensis]|nr:hypothetical protein SD51_08095 [Alicyclobacillus tengchongensis]
MQAKKLFHGWNGFLSFLKAIWVGFLGDCPIYNANALAMRTSLGKRIRCAVVADGRKHLPSENGTAFTTAFRLAYR